MTMESGHRAPAAANNNKPGRRLLNLGKLCLDKVRHPLSGAGAVGNVYNVSSATLTSYTSYGVEAAPDPRTAASAANGKAKAAANTVSKEETAVATVRNFVFVIAMSTHNVFEGMAIGECIIPSPCTLCTVP